MSVIAAALKHMLAAGMPADAIVAAVEEMENSLPLDEQAVRRRVADRDRKRSKRLRNSADSADTPLPDKEKSPTPPKENNPSPTSLRSDTQKRATRIPDDFEPDLKFATDEGLTVSQAKTEIAKFRDFWTAKSGKDATKLDWPATWRNWIRNCKPSGPSARGSPATKSAYRQHHDAVLQNLREAQGIFDNEREFAGPTLDL